MDWFRSLDNYCERIDPGYWAEPVNAITNAAFVVAAIWAWRLAARAGDRGAQVLAVILGLIGIGSYLFHTHAQVWSLWADVVPIQVFILVYVHLATVRFFGLPWWGGVLAAVAFVPYAALTARGLASIVGSLNGSIGYVPVPILIAGYAAALWRRRPEAARGLAVGAGILVVSLVFRSLDRSVCEAFPLGTHFMWHVLNAVMLGWMIRVMVRDRESVRS